MAEHWSDEYVELLCRCASEIGAEFTEVLGRIVEAWPEADLFVALSVADRMRHLDHACEGDRHIDHMIRAACHAARLCDDEMSWPAAQGLTGSPWMDVLRMVSGDRATGGHR